jgi:2-oxoglutarate ferredoxin oxidoreductase subunit beta
VLLAAAEHKGSAFVEIYQNCVIFNDGCFEEVVNKTVRDDRTIDLRHGEPMVFGKEGDKGLRIEGFEVAVVPAAQADSWKTDVHSPGPAFVMSQLDAEPDKPRPIGIFRNVRAPVFDEDMKAQMDKAVAARGPGRLQDLIYSGEMWTV